MPNTSELQAAWLKANKPSVTIEKPRPRTTKEVDDAIEQHKIISAIRAATKWPKATKVNSKAQIMMSTDSTMYNYGD